MMTKNWFVGAAAVAVLAASSAAASSHREAPFLTSHPKVDGTDFYMFRSYESGRSGFVTLIANYYPLQDPYGGPNYFALDPEALYEIHIDNDGDAKEDITFQFQFDNDLANDGNGAALMIGPMGMQKSVPVPLINIGPISAGNLDNLNRREEYTVRVIRGDRRTGMAQNVTNASGNATRFRKPVDYIGTKSFADYAAYAATHLYNVQIPGCSTNAKMFVGQRRESFAVNLGPIFDLVNAPATVITNPAARDAVPNPLDDKNITTFALEVPISCLKAGNQDVIAGWTTASVRQARVINPNATYERPAREGGAWAQVSRLGMPLVNEIVIGLPDKDRFNTSHPTNDGQFADYVTHPTLPALIEVLFGPTVQAPTLFPRTDLVAVFLTGVEMVNANGSTAEMLRLNTALPVTAAADQNNLGATACFVNGTLTPMNPGCDPAGFPNGRRPGDDVVDIALRVAMGYLIADGTKAPARNVPFHDAVLQDASRFDTTFPYLRTPLPGAKGDGT
jgi:hypothetical protein